MKIDSEILDSKNIKISNTLRKINLKKRLDSDNVDSNKKLIKRRISRPRWRRISSFIRKRDGHTCKICRSSDESKLQVHHIDFNESNDSLENLETLCASCHRKLHCGAPVISKDDLKFYYFDNGYSLRTIADIYSVSKYKIADMLKSFGFSVRTLSQARKNYLNKK